MTNSHNCHVRAKKVVYSIIILHMHAHMVIMQVPPSVCPTGGLAEVIANRGEVTTLSFTIKDATPPVMTEGIRWIYSPSFSLAPFNDTTLDITNLSTLPTTGSDFVFSDDQLNLTISNVVEDLQAGDNITDAGRYFLVATNAAGVAFSYIDLIITSQFLHFLFNDCI